jgi:hypothetical protein
MSYLSGTVRKNARRGLSLSSIRPRTVVPQEKIFALPLTHSGPSHQPASPLLLFFNDLARLAYGNLRVSAHL